MNSGWTETKLNRLFSEAGTEDNPASHSLELYPGKR